MSKGSWGKLDWSILFCWRMKEASSGWYSDFAMYDMKYNDRYQTSHILLQNVFLQARTVRIVMLGLINGYSWCILTYLSEAS